MNQLIEGLENLIEDIREVSKVSKDSGQKFEHNDILGYLSIEFNSDEIYFFDGDEYDNLILEYKNSCVYEHVWLEDYIRWSAQGW